MYMKHKCPSDTRHEELFQKFSDRRPGREGEIEWCTICGRITEQHRHFKITKADAPKPDYAAPRPTDQAEFFQNSCVSQGGGGFEEKIRRTHRLLN